MGQEEPKGRRAFRKILEDRNEKMRRLLMKMEAEDAKREAKDAAREQRAIREAVEEAKTFRDPLPLGHGEKSLYLIQRHMDLEPEEALAIRWHMGAYDNAAKGDGRALSAAMAASPWVWRLQQADMCAAWVDEREAAEE